MRLFQVLLSVLALAFPIIVNAGESPSPPPWPLALRHAVQRTADVTWRLREAAGTSCPSFSADSGIVVDSLDAYTSRDSSMVRTMLGMSDLVQVTAVATGSPAQQAGVHVGDEILALNGQATTEALPSLSDTLADEQDTNAMRVMAMFARLPAEQPARLMLLRDGAVIVLDLVPLNHCASRIFVRSSNRLDAYSDGFDVVITARLVDLTHSDDELALLVGHEMAHTIVRDNKASSLSQRRLMEERADLFGADLAACAGYDTYAAAPIWRRWVGSLFLSFLAIDPQHGSAKKRSEAIQQRAAPTTCPVITAPTLGP